MSPWYDAMAWTAEQWTAVATVATAVTAVAAVLFAGLQVVHARRLREEQAQPVVVVDFELNKTAWPLVDLVIRNTGQTIAHDVKISFSPPLSGTMDDGSFDLAKSALLTKGILTLPPGKEHRAIFDNLRTRLNEATNRFDKDGHAAEYSVTVTFKGSGKKKYPPLKYWLDLDVYGGVEHMGEQTFNDFAKDFHDFARKVGGVVSGSEFRVNVRDGDYSRWSDRWQENHSGGQRPRLGNPTPAGRRSPHKYDHLDAQEPRLRPADVGRPTQRAGRGLRRAIGSRSLASDDLFEGLDKRHARLPPSAELPRESRLPSRQSRGRQGRLETSAHAAERPCGSGWSGRRPLFATQCDRWPASGQEPMRSCQRPVHQAGYLPSTSSR